MSWTIETSGRAVWMLASDSRSICCDTAVPENGIAVSEKGGCESSDVVISLLPSNGQYFPPVDESYVRGNDLVCRYPQRSGDLFGLELCHRVIPIDASCLAIETICSIQTALLDCHPTCDVASNLQILPADDTDGDAIEESASPGPETALNFKNPVSLNFASSTMTPPAITRLGWKNSGSNSRGEVHLALPPSDRAAAAILVDEKLDYSFRYRLLAEFLEKGVIRKARVWTVVWSVNPSVQQIQHTYQQLLNEPLPLTP